MYCQDCGSMIPDQRRFCPNCGWDCFDAYSLDDDGGRADDLGVTDFHMGEKGGGVIDDGINKRWGLWGSWLFYSFFVSVVLYYVLSYLFSRLGAGDAGKWIGGGLAVFLGGMFGGFKYPGKTWTAPGLGAAAFCWPQLFWNDDRLQKIFLVFFGLLLALSGATIGLLLQEGHRRRRAEEWEEKIWEMENGSGPGRTPGGLACRGCGAAQSLNTVFCPECGRISDTFAERTRGNPELAPEKMWLPKRFDGKWFVYSVLYPLAYFMLSSMCFVIFGKIVGANIESAEGSMLLGLFVIVFLFIGVIHSAWVFPGRRVLEPWFGGVVIVVLMLGYGMEVGGEFLVSILVGGFLAWLAARAGVALQERKLRRLAQASEMGSGTIRGMKAGL